MNQDEIKDEIYNRIKDHIFYFLTELESEDEIAEAWLRLRQLDNKLKYLYFNFDKIQPDKIYKELKKILKKLMLVDDFIDELMSLIKTLDKEHLKDLIYNLEREFYTRSKKIESDLVELEAQNEEELEE